jgi:hypothetical protein
MAGPIAWARRVLVAALLSLAAAAHARPPDGGTHRPATSLEIRWILQTADLQDGRNNGFEARCGKPDRDGACKARGVWCGTVDPDRHARCAASPTQLDFYVQDRKRGPVVTTTVPCPGGAASGAVTVRLPEGKGPFLVWAGFGPPDPSHASSAWVDPFDRDSQVEVTIYVCGCNWERAGMIPTCGGQPKQ